MAVIAMQLDLYGGGSVNPLENVLFDTVTFVTGNIGYNPATGIITISQPGTYTFQWWVAPQSSPGSNGVTFSLACTAVKTGQVNGFNVIEVDSVPFTVSLRNDSAGTVYYSSSVAVKASLLVHAEVSTAAYGSKSVFSTPISLGDDPVEVPLDVPSDEYENVDMTVTNGIGSQQAGVYRVDAYVAGFLLETDANVTLFLNVNDTIVTNMYQTVTYTSSDFGTFNLSTYVRLEPNDRVWLSISSVPDRTFYFLVTGTGGHLSVQKVQDAS